MKNEAVTNSSRRSSGRSTKGSSGISSMPSLQTMMVYSCLIFSVLCVNGGFMGIALAATAVTSATKIGDTVTNPVSNTDVTVMELIKDPNGDLSYVVTSDGNTILAKTTVGDFLVSSDGADPPVITKLKVISVVTNATSGLVESVNVHLSTLPDTDPTTVPD